MVFDSLVGEQQLWISDTSTLTRMVYRLESLAQHHDKTMEPADGAWTVVPLNMRKLQRNSNDCGLWVLTTIAAVLRGYDTSGLDESNIVQL
ncbi:hypothetical protein C8J56DRAFT_1056275 [Mycena floridula]|nr:hypothetical protein C8J56DRAFT_1056275 [Mycena floridula]